jgi:3-hydroxyisobutyrate dehydrogenase-like beta-hydroxyacid dehydrogenase
MEVELIGLGKMGFKMATRLRQGGHTVVGLDFGAFAHARIITSAIVSWRLCAMRLAGMR